MKKIIIMCAIGFCLQTTTQAQNLLKSAGSTASAAGFDVNSITKDIMGKMTPTLGLSSAQQGSTTSAVTDFLTKKSGILGLQKSNPAAYASKFSSIFGGLKSKLGGILTATQMTKFMGMKPKTNDVTNVMSNLFY